MVLIKNKGVINATFMCFVINYCQNLIGVNIASIKLWKDVKEINFRCKNSIHITLKSGDGRMKSLTRSKTCILIDL